MVFGPVSITILAETTSFEAKMLTVGWKHTVRSRVGKLTIRLRLGTRRLRSLCLRRLAITWTLLSCFGVSGSLAMMKGLRSRSSQICRKSPPDGWIKVNANFITEPLAFRKPSLTVAVRSFSLAGKRGGSFLLYAQSLQWGPGWPFDFTVG